jgi:Zn-dependent M28 family amino/carboxypeptidase
MLNLDMISRNDPDSLQIIGAYQNPGLVKIIRKQNRSTGFILKESKGRNMGGGSDHINFYRKGIPAVFLFTGLHRDYHKVSDNPDRVDAEKAARVARLAFLAAWSMANEGSHYKVILPPVTTEE